MLVLSREAGSVLNLVKSDHIGVAIDSSGRRMNIPGVTGLTEAQKASLKALVAL